MRTTFDVVDILYPVLFASPMKLAISGTICKNKRPVNSGEVDVVINSLPITGDQLQEGIVNVNIHVPNLKLSIGGIQDRTQQDHETMKELTAQAVGILNDLWLAKGELSFSILTQSIFEEPEIFEHYVNLRLSYRAVNI